MVISRVRVLTVLALAAAAVGAIWVIVAVDAFGTAARGNVQFAELDGEKEDPDADADGYGSFSFAIRGTKLCYGLSVFAIANPTAAHIHTGAAGDNGPIAVTLPSVPASGQAGSSSACVEVDVALRDQIRLNPAGFYVNVHNGTFPNGALRGQLFEATAAQDK